MGHAHVYAEPVNAAIPDGKSAESAVEELLDRVTASLEARFKGRANPKADYESWSVELLVIHNDSDTQATHFMMSVALQVKAADAKTVTIAPWISIDAEVRQRDSNLRWVPPDPDPRVGMLYEEITNALV